MKAAEARSIVDDEGLDELISEIVAQAPPLPAEAADLWRRAVRRVRRHCDDSA